MLVRLYQFIVMFSERDVNLRCSVDCNLKLMTQQSRVEIQGAMRKLDLEKCTLSSLLSQEMDGRTTSWFSLCFSLC